MDPESPPPEYSEEESIIENNAVTPIVNNVLKEMLQLELVKMTQTTTETSTLSVKTHKVLIIGDTHFKVSDVEESTMMCNAIYALCETHKDIDFIVMLGDTLDTHAVVNVGPFNRALDFIKQCSQYAPVYLIIGNHDRPNNSVFCTDEHPFNAIKAWDRVHVIDYPTVRTIDDKQYIFAPYVPPGRFEESLNLIKTFDKEGNYVTLDWKKDITCIFSHQEYRGAQMGIIKSEHGDAWPEEYPYIISGHVHDYDQLQSNILYTGTPKQHSQADRPDKRVYMAQFTDPSKRFLQPFDLGLPRKYTVHVDVKDIGSYNLEALVNGRDNVKIVLEGDAAELKELKRNKTLEWLPSHIKVAEKKKSTVPTFDLKTSNVSDILVTLIQKEADGEQLLNIYRQLLTT